ncbi:MAG: DHH family phosphoesterase [Candidatus Falkowbacteria bacterium]|nr:DHH family phosphoesterase [Candidatus Falkowbacteria bacterium]
MSLVNELKNNSYSLVAGHLKSARRVLAITHINPDGDALGSLCFFNELISKLNKDCTMYCAGPLPASLGFLRGWTDIITDKTKINLADYDLLVSLDCATPGRTNLETEIFNRRKDQLFLEIDHHPSNRKLSDCELRLPEAASTTEVLFGLASFMKLEVDPTMAQSLLTGIVTDTGHFIHATATNDTISAAASIITRGASLTKIANSTAKTKTLAGLRIWGRALSRLTRNKKFGLVYTVLTEVDFKEHEADESVIDGISSFLSSLNEARVVMVLYESKGLIRGSLRSIDKTVDVARLARLFGGGGHVLASGFTVKGQLAIINGTWQAIAAK